MLLYPDLILPTVLTGYVREALADRPQNALTLDRWLPNNNIDDLEYRFTAGGEGLLEAATYRTYDAESPIGKRPGLTRVTGELPPISRKIRLGEYDRLRQRVNGADQVQQALFGDGERMGRAVAARLELARGDALTNGSVTISENGVQAVVSFGRAGAHTVTAGTLWSNTASADPISDMLAWQLTYYNTNGVYPGYGLMSLTTLNYLIRNLNLRGLLAANGVTPNIITRSAMFSLFESFGLPPMEVYQPSVNVAGSATPIIPANRFLYLPAPGDPEDPGSTQLGATLLGTTAESLEPEYGIAQADQPGIVVGVYKTADPVALWTKAAGIGLPVLANPNLSFAATVA